METPAGIPYDEQLRDELERDGLERLRQGGTVVVDGIDDPARYHTAVWFACKWGLRWTNVPYQGRVVIELDERG